MCFNEKKKTIHQVIIDSVIELLHKQNIEIKAKSVGGSQRRSISLDVENGSVYYSVGGGAVTPLLCFLDDK